MKKQAIIFVLLAVVFMLLTDQILAAQKEITESTHILFILDASKSMEEPIEGNTKIEIVRDTLSDIIRSLPDSIKIGIMVYGHRHEEDCGDIEELVEPITQNREKILKKINEIRPAGKAPIADSIQKAVENLHAPEEKITLFLITSEKDNCSSDPCEKLRQFKDTHGEFQFILNVIGFDVNEEARVQLECLARIGEGTYYSANTGQELKIAAENAIKSFITYNNFEAIVKDNADAELTTWTGQIFSIADAKALGNVSPDDQRTHLPSGNYVVMLRFKEEIPGLKGHRPFTFIITEGHKTTFTLVIGASEEPEMEKGVLRTVKGEDYLNFFLPAADPNLCKTKCEKDRNCGAYTYCYTKQRRGRCYLIRGVGTPGPARPGSDCLSGVIQRAGSSPYRIHITTEKLNYSGTTTD